MGKECRLVVIDMGNLGGGANKLELSTVYDPLSIVDEMKGESSEKIVTFSSVFVFTKKIVTSIINFVWQIFRF